MFTTLFYFRVSGFKIFSPPQPNMLGYTLTS